MNVSTRVELDMRPAEGLRKGGIRRAMRIGMSRAASPVKASVVAHAEAIRRYGFLAKSIRIKLRSYPAERFVAVIGPASKFKAGRGKFKKGKRAGQPRKFVPSKYAHLVERGTKTSRARPFLEPAQKATSGAFLRRVGVEIGREIEQELAKAK